MAGPRFARVKFNQAALLALSTAPRVSNWVQTIPNKYDGIE